MIGGAPEGTAAWHMELQIHKVIERALCDYFGISHGEFVSSSHFDVPDGFTCPPWAMTIAIPAGSWLFDKFPWLLAEGRIAMPSEPKSH